MEYHRGDAFESSDVIERIFYYHDNVVPYPTAIFDGTSRLIGAEPETFSDYLSTYYAELSNPSPCTLNILAEYDSTTRFLKVKSRVTGIDTLSNAHLRYAITESHIYHRWGSKYAIWLDSLHHVVRKMLPDYSGTTFSITPGESFVDSQTYVLDSTWNDKNCYVVVFVQKDDSGTPVLSSTKSGPLCWFFGDANRDGSVSLEDVLFLVDYVFEGGPVPEPIQAADLNCDQQVNILDVIHLINYLFKSGPQPCE